jgi:hypothetical protein
MGETLSLTADPERKKEIVMPAREQHPPREPIANSRAAAAVSRPQGGAAWLYRLCMVLILLWTAFCFAGACYGMVNIANQPVPMDAYAKAGRDVGTAIGLGMWAVVWVIPTVGLGVIGLLAKPR